MTSYVLYQAGCIRASGVVAAGGINVTSDLAIGLRVPTSIAEKVKIESGLAIASLAADDEIVTVPDASGRFSKEIRRGIIGAIMEPRYEEIFMMVKERIASMPYYKMLGGGIILTGGASMTEGVELVAEQVFDLPVRKAKPVELEGLSEVVSREDWSSSVGLLLEGVENLEKSEHHRASAIGLEGIFRGLKKIASFF